jgi:hypothetical protein
MQLLKIDDKTPIPQPVALPPVAQPVAPTPAESASRDPNRCGGTPRPAYWID